MSEVDPSRGLIADHRAIEDALDSFAVSLHAGELTVACLLNPGELLRQHYRREARFLATLSVHEPALSVKLTAQHDEALEILACLEESLAAEQAADVVYLARRFLAIVRHNMIEEERDVFPLARRCFPAQS